MGLMPVVRGKVTRDYPDTLGATPYTARLSATFIAGPIGCFLSHPFDTVKTCMQVTKPFCFDIIPPCFHAVSTACYHCVCFSSVFVALCISLAHLQITT
jgi:hypothetical protein